MEEWDDIGDSQNYVDRQGFIHHAVYHSPYANRDNELYDDEEEMNIE